MKPVIELRQATVTINPGSEDKKNILDQVDLTIYDGDFVTLLGGNGAGKSTLFNVIAGTLPLTSGQVLIGGQDVTKLPAQDRAKYLSRVFQDPKMGTAPRMTVAENLLIAQERGQKRRLVSRQLAQHRSAFQELLAQVGNSLEEHLDSPAGSLSGGQRQALSLLMATLKRPDLLLLDEHTAALDPKTSQSLMALTQRFVAEDQLTALMITHQMADALTYGNRLLVMKQGRIIRDLTAEEKQEMTIQDYYQLFE